MRPLPPSLIYKGGLSAAVGMIIGVVVSLVVNCTLVEISLSAFFSLYFGILSVAGVAAIAIVALCEAGIQRKGVILFWLLEPAG